MKNYATLLIWLTCWQAAISQPITDAQLSTQFDSLLAKQFKANGPGCTALVARKGKIIYQKAFGMASLELNVLMQPDHVFRIGSMTKQFTAVAILQLMEQGKLSLQDEITRFIPDYPNQGKKITIEHLLTHTSGIKSYTNMKEFASIEKNDMSPTAVIDFFKNQPMEFEPGTKWQYCNSGYFLLGYIIEKVSGKTYAKYLEDTFFKPLGMSSSYYGDNIRLIKKRASGYQADKDSILNADYMSMTQPYSAGAIQSTVGDLWKWHQAVHSNQLVKKETLVRAFTAYTLSNGQPTDYGYGWAVGSNIRGSSIIQHGGAINGYLTQGIYLPQEDVFVVVFSNSTSNSTDDVAAKMAAMVIGKPYPTKEIVIDAKRLQTYSGVYENDEGEQRVISVRDGHLYSQRVDGAPFKLKAYEKDRFYFDAEVSYLEFIRNRAGQIEKIRYQSLTGSELWKKVDKPVKPSR